MSFDNLIICFHITNEFLNPWQMTRLFGVDDEFGEDAILGKLEGMKDVIEQVNKQFKDPVRPSLPLPPCNNKLFSYMK